MKISNVHLVSAPRQDQRRGLVGWVSCVVDGTIRLDGLAVRKTAEGALTLSFPARRSGSGDQFFFIRPLDDRARREIERQVLAGLGLEEAARP